MEDGGDARTSWDMSSKGAKKCDHSVAGRVDDSDPVASAISTVSDGSILPAESILSDGELTAGAVRLLTGELVIGAEPGTTGELLELIEALTTLGNALAGTQARMMMAYDQQVREADRAAGASRHRQGRSVVDSVATATGWSPWQAGHRLSLVRDAATCPHLWNAYTAGSVSTEVVEAVVREIRVLRPEQRVSLDQDLVGTLTRTPKKRLVADVRRLVIGYDPAAVLKRHQVAVNDRHVWIRPLAEGMVCLSAYLPLVEGIASYKALQDAAVSSLVAGGEPGASEAEQDDELAPVRTKSQLMADLMVERLTGRVVADPVDIEINLLMTPEALFGDTTQPLSTYDDEGVSHNEVPAIEGIVLTRRERLEARVAHAVGTVVAEGLDPAVLPAGAVKELLVQQDQATVFIRKVFGRPGNLVAMESNRRTFSGLLRKFVILRDQYCTTPHCAAPIRHIDHRVPASRGGPTTAANAAGLCAHCNLAKAEREGAGP